MLARKQLVVIGAVVLMWPMLPVQAQKMYRCGNSYQDQPCAGAQQGKVMGNVVGGAAPTAATSKQPTDAQCARRGAEALKVVWMRDNGASKERQIADLASNSAFAGNPEEGRQLIESVYSKRGSAPEVRSAIEAECIAEKERYAQAAALAAAALKLQGGGTLAAPTASPGAVGQPDLAKMEARQNEEIAANQAAFKQSRCADLARQYENLRREERVGGSI